MNALIFAVLFFSTFFATAEELGFHSLYSSCIDELNVVEPIYSQTDFTVENSCKEYSESKLNWLRSGKPTYYVDKNSCLFLGITKPAPESCLPHRLPEGINSVLIVIGADANEKSYISVLEKLKNIGVKDLLLEIRG